MTIKKSEWYLIAVSIAVGSIITITYNTLAPCFEGLFQKDIQSFTCDANSPAQIFAGLVAFLAGIVYLKIFMASYKKNKMNSNPET